MTTYGIYLESGPRHSKTMAHVLDLLGCIANGPTTEEVIEATPAAIAAYRRFLQRCGERVSTTAPITTRVEEHITEGIWIGNGMPYITFAPDLDHITHRDVGRFARRFEHLYDELAAWAETRRGNSTSPPPTAARHARSCCTP